MKSGRVPAFAYGTVFAFRNRRRFKAIDARFERVDVRLDSLEEKLDTIVRMLGSKYIQHERVLDESGGKGPGSEHDRRIGDLE
jgi:hypothetical protein